MCNTGVEQNLPVQKSEQGASRHKLCDNAEVRGVGASSHEEHHIRVFQPLHDAHLSSKLLQDYRKMSIDVTSPADLCQLSARHAHHIPHRGS